MSIPLIFFFLSLASIVLMLGRKLAMVRDGHADHLDPEDLGEIRFSAPDLDKIKHLTLKNTKKLGYVALFVAMRSFIKSSNFVKVKSKMLAKKIKNKFKKETGEMIEELEEKKEVSKYLRIISEYRQKIRKMKNAIKEEEGIE